MSYPVFCNCLPGWRLGCPMRLVPAAVFWGAAASSHPPAPCPRTPTGLLGRVHKRSGWPPRRAIVPLLPIKKSEWQELTRTRGCGYLPSPGMIMNEHEYISLQGPWMQGYMRAFISRGSSPLLLMVQQMTTGGAMPVLAGDVQGGKWYVHVSAHVAAFVCVYP
eukprot:502650-Pelagomonas_calceolata.AAC.1